MLLSSKHIKKFLLNIFQLWICRIKLTLYVLMCSVLTNNKRECLEWPWTVNLNNNDPGEDMSRHDLLANHLLRSLSYGMPWPGDLLLPDAASVTIAGTNLFQSDGLLYIFIKCVVPDLLTSLDFLPLTPAPSLRNLFRSHQKSLFVGTAGSWQGQIQNQQTC